MVHVCPSLQQLDRLSKLNPQATHRPSLQEFPDMWLHWKAPLNGACIIQQDSEGGTTPRSAAEAKLLPCGSSCVKSQVKPATSCT